MNKSKMVDINLTEFGTNVVLRRLNESFDVVCETDSTDRLHFMEVHYLNGMLEMLRILDIEPVFDGDSYVGLLAGPLVGESDE